MKRSIDSIRTRRLTLRRLHPDDAERIAVLAGDWAVASMTDRIPYPYSTDDARFWMDNIDDNEIVFAIEFAGEFVGVCGTMILNETEAEIGYWIGKPWWGQGFATEAAEALVKFCFRRLKLATLHCCHFDDNDASRRVIEKLGFTPVGRRNAWSDARRRDSHATCYKLKRPRLAFLWRRAA